jgi:hypothetical protein
MAIKIATIIAIQSRSLTQSNKPFISHPDVSEGRQILACPDQLKQVLLNLIENADKYSPKDSPIEVGLLHTLAGSTIQVKDHGDGILPDELPHIFERFYRGSSSHRQAGSGLGLSVVQLLVEAMGAAIQVESSPGQGSCFSLHWRADPPQVPA